MKKILALLLTAVMIFSLAACGEGGGTASKKDSGKESKSDIKVGFIFPSAMQQVQRLIQKSLLTSTMHLLPFMKADSLQVLLQVLKSTK